MTATATPRRTPGLSTIDLALVATFAAFIAVCAILPSFSIGLGTVPFTFQMFGIFLAGAVLGARRGFLAVILYLAVGTAGLPIFAKGTAGPSVWVSPTVGYLIAFPLAALLVGVVAARLARRTPPTFTIGVSVVAAIVTVVVVGTFGTIGMAIQIPHTDLHLAWTYATPFFILDILKGIIAAIVAASVHRAFPQLAPRR